MMDTYKISTIPECITNKYILGSLTVKFCIVDPHIYAKMDKMHSINVWHNHSGSKHSGKSKCMHEYDMYHIYVNTSRHWNA